MSPAVQAVVFAMAVFGGICLGYGARALQEHLRWNRRRKR